MADRRDINRRYWNTLADTYQSLARITLTDFHFAPLLPGNADLQILPPITPEMRCLEFGSGAGQNSIFLASKGALCTATDIAEEQLAHGRALADSAGAAVRWQTMAMEDIHPDTLGHYDLVHSAYALPFAEHPDRVIRAAANCLQPGGHLLISTAHPVFAGEWLELDGDMGVFLPSYFTPPADDRPAPGGHRVESRAWPLCDVFRWMTDAGLTVVRMEEPRPLPVDTMTDAAIRQRVPYDSDAWRELYPKLAAIPVAAIFLARR